MLGRGTPCPTTHPCPSGVENPDDSTKSSATDALSFTSGEGVWTRSTESEDRVSGELPLVPLLCVPRHV